MKEAEIDPDDEPIRAIKELIWEAMCDLEPIKDDRCASKAIASLNEALYLATSDKRIGDYDEDL